MQINTRVFGVLACVLGILLIVFSSILLADKIEERNEKQQYQSYYNGYWNFWNTFKLEEDLIIVLAPICMIVGLIQILYPVIVFKEPNGARASTHILLWTTAMLLLLSIFSFVTALAYRIDLKRLFQYTGGFGSRNYTSTQFAYFAGNSYNTYREFYTKAQLFLAVLGIDVILLCVIFVWMVRRLFNLSSDPHEKYKYHSQRNLSSPDPSGSRSSPV